MKTLTKLICSLLLASGFVQAQTIITGKVVNYKNKAVSGAELYLDSTATQVTTNKSGEYTLVVPENVKTLKVHSNKYGWLSSAYAKETKMDFMYLDTAPTTDTEAFVASTGTTQVTGNWNITDNNSSSLYTDTSGTDDTPNDLVDFNISFPHIGRELGGRDHTTVIHSCVKVKEELEKNPTLVQEIEQIRSMLQTY